MAGGEEAVVSAHDWVRGITFSILASMIGGASKLSIRKSWLIHHARRRQQQFTQNQNHQDRIKGLLFRGLRDAYEEVFSPKNSSHKQHYEKVDITNMNGDENDELQAETNYQISPLEVGLSPDRSNHHLLQDESFSSQHDTDTDHENSISNQTTNAYLFNDYSYIESTNQNNSDLSNNYSPAMTILSQKQISWLLYVSGMIGMSFLNPLCCVLAMKYANPSILAPFSGLTLVWVVLFSGVVVNEHPGRSQQIACCLIVLGEILVAMFGDHTNGEDATVDDVISSYQEPAFHIFIVLMTLYLVQLCIFIWVCPKYSLLKKVAWGSIGGSITGYQNFLKDALTIFDVTTKQSNSSNHNSLSGGSSHTSLPSSFFLFVLLAMTTSFVGLLCLASCMKRYDATYSAAMFVVSFVVSASLMSGVHYHTFEHLSGDINLFMYPVGLSTLFLGAFILVKPDAIQVADRNCFNDIITGMGDHRSSPSDESLYLVVNTTHDAEEERNQRLLDSNDVG